MTMMGAVEQGGATARQTSPFRVGGDLAGKLGTALLAEIASAPLNTDRFYKLQIAVDGREELIEFQYFIDDIDDVDVYLIGSHPLHGECLAAFETL